MSLPAAMRIPRRAGALALSLAACHPGDTGLATECEPDRPTSLSVGTGDDTSGFIALGDGSDLHIVPTENLAWRMLVFAVRTTGIDPGGDPEDGWVDETDPEVRIGVYRDDVVVAGTVVHVELAAADSGHEALGLRALVTIDDVDSLDGANVRVEASVEDACQHRAEDLIALRLVY